MATLVRELDVSRTHPDNAEATRAAGDDADAFEVLYRRHVGRIHTLVCRMIGETEADDVTQEVFIRAWQKLALFRGESAFGTWLHRLAVNVVLARRQTLAARRGRFIEEDEPVERPDRRAVGPELKLDFEAAMTRLPDGARQVFVLYDVEGYKHEEIAGMLGINVGTSKSQLHRARMTLRQYLER